MINLSVDTRTLSSSLPKDHLETILSEMINLVEMSFNIIIEEIDGDNSYWTHIEEGDCEEMDIFGIIEIGQEQSPFQKIISVTHECGHVLHQMDPLFKDSKNILFNESLAWYLGYHFMDEHGYTIDIKEYRKEISYALNLYRRSLNAGDVK